VGGAALAACTPTTPPAATQAPAATQSSVATAVPTKAVVPSAYKESPMLAELVKAGKLPTVDQRLPKSPAVFKPVEETGKYGGTLRLGDTSTPLWSITCLRCTGLFKYNQTNTEVSLDMAKSYKFSPDGKVLTLELREGHKWSDGSPFTVDDILFWWEDIQNNKELTPTPDKFWRPGGKPAEFKKISDTTLEITFAVPYPVVVDRLGRSWFSSDTNFMAPKAFLSKWHIKYNAKADDVAKEEKFEGWTKAFIAHLAPINPSTPLEIGRPMLFSWLVESKTAERTSYVRNPYFYAVDPEGNQLPYIDKMDAVITGNLDVQALKTSAGEFDFESYYTALKNMPVYKQNEQKGGFRVLQAKSMRVSQCALMPNRNTPDLVLRDLFNKKDFRVALSLGINRKAMADTIFFGLATPHAATCSPFFPFYKKEWASMYTELDVTKANSLLDGLGLKDKDAQGFRLRSDGKGRISLLLEIGVTEGPKQEMMEMVKKDWEKIGIEAQVKFYDGALFNQKHLANELIVPTWHLDRSGMFGRADPLFYGWDNPTQQRWGGQWALWFSTDGKEGMEPPAEIKKIKGIHDKWRQSAIGSPEFNSLGAEYFAYFAEEIPMIGTVGLEVVPMVVNSKLRNVPEKDIYWSSDTNFYAPYTPQQWFFKS